VVQAEEQEVQRCRDLMKPWLHEVFNC